MDTRARTSPWCKGRPCFTPEAWEPWSGGVIVPDTARRWKSAPARTPCGRYRRTTTSYEQSPL